MPRNEHITDDEMKMYRANRPDLTPEQISETIAWFGKIDHPAMHGLVSRPAGSIVCDGGGRPWVDLPSTDPAPDQAAEVKALGPIQLTIGALGRSIDRLEDQVINLASNLAPVLKPAVPAEGFTRDLDETLPEIGQMVLDQVDRIDRLHWIVSDLLDRLGV